MISTPVSVSSRRSRTGHFQPNPMFTGLNGLSSGKGATHRADKTFKRANCPSPLPALCPARLPTRAFRNKVEYHDEIAVTALNKIPGFLDYSGGT